MFSFEKLDLKVNINVQNYIINKKSTISPVFSKIDQHSKHSNEKRNIALNLRFLNVESKQQCVELCINIRTKLLIKQRELYKLYWTRITG